MRGSGKILFPLNARATAAICQALPEFLRSHSTIQDSIDKVLKSTEFYVLIETISDSTFLVDLVTNYKENGNLKSSHNKDTCIILQQESNGLNDFSALDYKTDLNKLDKVAMSSWDLFSPIELVCHDVILRRESKSKVYLIGLYW